MKPDRNPDINLDTEALPPGCYLLAGQYLMLSARRTTPRRGPLPYGVAYRIDPDSKRITEGLILRESDRLEMERRLTERGGKKKGAGKGHIAD